MSAYVLCIEYYNTVKLIDEAVSGKLTVSVGTLMGIHS
jgi:hypothetical protein